jgi:AcrR family transcriptional regulator
MKQQVELEKAIQADSVSDPAKARKKTGRPLSFDRDVALERAMLVFWRYGYEAASLQELTSAMGITPPSLYAAFGDKEQLFLEAVARYSDRNCSAVKCLFAEAPTARDAIERWLQSCAIESTCPSHPPGCMVVTAATNCSASAGHVQDVMVQRRGDLEELIRQRIEQGIAEGDLPPTTDAPTLAGFYVTVMHGMTTQARDTHDCEKLLAIVAAAMRAWPD